jgi:hypothetical protein
VTWWRIGNTAETEKQLEAELRFDYEQRVADKIRAGMSNAEAHRAATLEFGGVERVKDECRDVRGFPLLHSLWQDVACAFRIFARTPGFTAVAVMTLAVGIAINAAVFTLTNALLLGGFPLVTSNDRLAYITTNGNCCVSYPSDPMTYVVTFGVLALAAALGCWIPARRAMRVDPAVALRHE